MYTCDRCRDLIWDDLFGLLDSDEHDRLQHHLADCGLCQGEFARAEYDRRRLADAARLEIAVPLFKMPSLQPATIPIESINGWRNSHGRRSRLRPWHAVAAGILLLILVPYGLYQNGLTRRQTAYHLAESRLDAVIAERKSEQDRFETTTVALKDAGRAQALRVQVVGPADHRTGSENQYRVLASHLDGKPADAQVRARVLGAGDRLLFETQELSGKGELVVSLPANLTLHPDEAARLEVLARSAGEQALVREELRAQKSPYLTQLSLDRSWHAPGERVFFRSVTLDRFALTPPAESLRLTYTLRDAQGREVATPIRGSMRNDGIGCGEFTLPRAGAQGEYTLTVAEAQNRFPAVARHFRIGSQMPNARRAPAAAASVTVDFFPEGGDLIAGLPSRVYFRVQSGDGQEMDGRGRIVDARGDAVATAQTAADYGRGSGVFSFTPQPGASYHMELSEPAGMKTAFALPPVRADGVALSTPTAVTRNTEPLRVIVRQAGPEREVIVGVFCRGRLVGQAIRALRARETDVEIPLAAGASGVLRVTVYENRDGQLRPLAERLAYRLAAAQMHVAVQGDKEHYKAGAPVKLFVRGQNEEGKAEPASFLVSVVKQAVAGESIRDAQQGLPAHFYLAADFDHPESLEQADFLIRDEPATRAALDLFLGTQGWRRFTIELTKPSVALAAAGSTNADGLVLIDNLAHAEQKYEAGVGQALSGAQARLDALTAEAKTWMETTQDAAGALSSYRMHAGEYFRVGVGSLALLLFAAALVLLMVSGVRVVRGIAYPRRYVAGAFVSLSLCGLAVFGLRDFGEGAAALEQRLAVLGDAVHGIAPPAIASAQSKGAMAEPREIFARVGPKSTNAAVVSRADGDAPELARANGASAPRVLPFSIQRNRPFVSNPLTPPPLEMILPVREYARRRQTASAEAGDTIVWKPVIAAAGGTAVVNFDLPEGPGTYHIRVDAHSANGRLGTTQATLRVR
jgi:hypothetical protein